MTNMSENNSLFDRLMRSVKAGRIVHALLFTGPAGSGRHHAAVELMTALMCTGVDKPCGICPACKQMAAGSHPDMYFIVPEKKSIGVDQIRKLGDKLKLRPYEGRMHGVIIDNAETLTISAQNALLKTLEEPSGQVVFVLIAPTRNAVIPTIASRCLEVHFAPMSVEKCVENLRAEGFSKEEAVRAAGMAQGALDRAHRIIEDGEVLMLRNLAIESLNLTVSGESGVIEATAMLEKDKMNTDGFLNAMEALGRDLMSAKAGVKPFYDDVYKMDEKLDGCLITGTVMKIRKMLSSNVQWNYAVEYAYLKLANKVNE